jgi:hypothetical protein
MSQLMEPATPFVSSPFLSLPLCFSRRPAFLEAQPAQAPMSLYLRWVGVMHGAPHL